MPLHPSLDLLLLYLVASYFKNKLAFVDFYELPLLTFPNNCFHLLWLNILVLSPLTYARSVLT